MSSAAKHSTSAVTTGIFPRRSMVEIIRAPRASSPERTISIGSERQAGKNGWFTKQRSGCSASAAICFRGMPEVAKPIRQSEETTPSRPARIFFLTARSSLAASRTYSQSFRSPCSRVGTIISWMAAAALGLSLPRATPFFT
jgi:hypothetical protein